MKKITLLVAVFTLVLLFVSCNKEGLYNPKKKIEKIYSSMEYKSEFYNNGSWNVDHDFIYPKYLAETWNWEGNRLRSISYYTWQGILYDVETFEYAGLRLSAISWGSGERFVINYKQGAISSIEGFDGTEKTVHYEFTHKNGKIRNIKIWDYANKKESSPMRSTNTLRFFIPSADTKSLAAMMTGMQERMNEKLISTYDIDLEWNGKNVSKLTYQLGDHSISYEYSYDNNENPFYGLFESDEMREGLIRSASFGEWILSKNNVISTTHTSSATNTSSVLTFDFTYEGRYPTMRSYYDFYTSDNIRITNSEVLYYEYK